MLTDARKGEEAEYRRSSCSLRCEKTVTTWAKKASRDANNTEAQEWQTCGKKREIVETASLLRPICGNAEIL